MRLQLGTKVHCTDEEFGELSDIVIDPIGRNVTHLVVQPQHQHHLARLVPIALANAGDGPDAAITLGCSADHVRQLEAVHEFAYLRMGDAPVEDPNWEVGVEDVLALPYFDSSGFVISPSLDPHYGVTYDRIPKGEVEIRRDSGVVSKDDHDIGRIDGFLVDGEDQITHMVLRRGHLWGEREITVPIGAVARVMTDAVTLSLTREEVGDLPAVPVRRWPLRRGTH